MMISTSLSYLTPYVDEYSRILRLKVNLLDIWEETKDTKWGGLTSVNPYNPNSYIIRLNPKVIHKTSNVDVAEILAHEMIHVWQLASGRLVFNDTLGYLTYASTKYAYSDVTWYSTKTPWEKEAYSNQYKLYELAKNELHRRTNRKNSTGIRICTLS